MIPSSAELTSAIRGALLLARFDAQGFNAFDRTLEGFWKSFFAAVLTGPLQLLLSFEVASASGGQARLGDDWLLGLLAFIVHWLAFPVVMLSVVDWLDRRQRYFAFMVAFNWSNLPQVVLLLLVYSPAVAGLMPPQAAQLLGSVVFAFILAYEWYIAKAGLDISGGKAVAVIVLDLLVSFGIFAAAAAGQG